MGFEPRIVYRERRNAMEWLHRVFGFETSLVVEQADGQIGAASMTFDGGTVWLVEEQAGAGDAVERMASPMAVGGVNTQSVEVHMADGIDAHFELARANQAIIVQDLADQFYGARTYRALDLEGHLWTFLQPKAMAEDAMTSRGLKVRGSP